MGCVLYTKSSLPDFDLRKTDYDPIHFHSEKDIESNELKRHEAGDKNEPRANENANKGQA